MKFRQPASRRTAWALWVCALALLLKAAMPMLASASAHAQGRALVEICTVYGVASVGLGAPDDDDSDAATHRPQHCALSALLAGSAPEPQALVWRLTPRLTDCAPGHDASASPPPIDACAAWVAQLRHGPPTGA